jgi:hypothetical protein
METIPQIAVKVSSLNAQLVVFRHLPALLNVVPGGGCLSGRIKCDGKSKAGVGKSSPRANTVYGS